MKRLILITLILLVCPISAFSHPGKTDRYGGHKCLKDCEEWILFYAEYHLHDKDGKPIRVGKKRRVQPDKPELKSYQPEPPVSEPAPLITTITKTVTEYRYIKTVAEENILSPNPLYWVVVVLLLLLLIIRRNRRDPDKS